MMLSHSYGNEIEPKQQLMLNRQLLDELMSEATIYQNAVEKRVSTSSEDDMVLELSDESLNNSNPYRNHNFTGVVKPSTSMRRDDNFDATKTDEQMIQANIDIPRALTPEERTEKLIHEAETAKAKIFPPTGKAPQIEFVALIDQDYSLVGSHVDEHTQLKIIKGEFIDFSKLLPREKINEDEGNRMELIIKNGKTFWSPASDNVTISNFGKWEQAFRIFLNIYTKAHPEKSTELIQYNHIIHSIASTYVWENVYAYDHEFRLHISRHPGRNWGIILQQAWSMKLKDRASHFEHNSSHGSGQSSRGNGSSSGGKQFKSS